jgi:hypothetical protein
MKSLGARRRVTSVVLCVVTTTLLSTMSTTPVHSASNASAASVLGVSNFRAGAIHLAKSLDGSGDPVAVKSGRDALHAATHLETQWLMGNGAANPEPSPGVYSWTSLDFRINKVMAGADEVVLTAVGAPDWMKGGVAGQTDWSKLDVAPRPDYYDEYADLVAAAVQRYPSIASVQVWSELRGFWLTTQNRWDYENYTRLYNLVYQRVKAVRPTVKVGGPYVAIASNGGPHFYNSKIGGTWGWIDQRALDAIAYWLHNNVGADFIAVDAQNRNKDAVQATDEFATLDKFGVFVSWLRGLDPITYPGAAQLPLRWTEWYALTFNSADSDAKKNALIGAGLIRTIKTGSESASFWGVTGDKTGHYWLNALTTPNYELTLLTDSSVVGGGQPTVMYPTVRAFDERFGVGTPILVDGNTNPNVETISSATNIMAVNKTNTVQTGQALGISFTLQPYEVRLMPVV